MKLYEITGQARLLDEFIGDINNSEDAKAFSDLYAEISESFDAKVHSVCCVIKNAQGEVDSLAVEIKRLSDRKKACETKVESLKTYLNYEMQKLDKQIVKTPLFTVAFQKNPESCKVDETALAHEWFKVERKPDLSKVKEALKNGIHIDGAWLESSESLRIR